MSFADYSQTFDDHRSLLVLVRPVGAIKVATFNDVFEEISGLSDVVCPLSSDSSARYLRLRFKRTYPIENNAWGDFQAHRKVAGLLCVATFTTQAEFDEAYRHYEILRDKYASSLFDSRILLLWDGEDRNSSGEDGAASGEGRASDDGKDVESLDELRGAAREGTPEELDASTLSKSIDNLDSKATESSPSEIFHSNILLPEERRDFLTISRSDQEDESSSGQTQSLGSSLPPCSPNREVALATAHSRHDEEEEETPPASKDFDVIDDPLRGPDREETFERNDDVAQRQPAACLSPPAFTARKGALTLMTSSRAEIADGVGDLADSLFWALESRCIDVSLNRQPTLAMAPFEKKEFVGVDADSRNHRRRCQGRHLKQLADLFLQAGLPDKAIFNYQSALDILRNINDFLWMGGAEEGVAIASAILHYRLPSAGNSLEQDFLVLKGKKSSAGRASSDQEAFSDGSGALPPHQNSTSGQQQSQHHPTPSQIQKVMAHHRSGSHGSAGLQQTGNATAERGELSGSNGSLTQSDTEFSAVSTSSSTALQPAELVETYKEAVIHYSKCRHAGIVEMEASIKATQILILQKRFLLAHDFLQNVIYINLQLSDEEKISRYTTLSDLYTSTGFYRKAAFFRRVAAMQCVAPTNPRPTWQQCFDLLLDTMQGYKFALDHKENVTFGKPHKGWPILQKRLLHELVFTARKMGQLEVAVRLLILYLECLHHDMKNEEISQMTELLSSYAQRANNAQLNVPLELSKKGFVIPPVCLTWLPELVDFCILPTKPGCTPSLMSSATSAMAKNESGRGSPFIYSPLNLRSPRAGEVLKSDAKTSKATSATDCVVAQGDVISFRLSFANPVSFDVHVNKLRVSTSEGLATDCLDGSLVIAACIPTPSTIEEEEEKGEESGQKAEAAVIRADGAQSSPTSVVLTGIPEISGQLVVSGYELEIFGVKNSILFSDLALASKLHLPLSIEVVPSLPQVSLDLAVSGHQSRNGEDPNNIKVEALETVPYFPLFNKAQRFKSVLSAHIDISAGESREVSLRIANVGRVPLDNVEVTLEHPAADTSRTRQSHMELMTSCISYDEAFLRASLPLAPGGVASLPVTLSGVFESSKEAESPLNESAGSSPSSASNVNALLSLSYSGGAGFAAGFCRHAAVAVALHVRPSVLVVHCVAESTSPVDADDASTSSSQRGNGSGESTFRMSLKLKNAGGGSVNVWARRRRSAELAEGAEDRDDGLMETAQTAIPPDGESILSLELPKVRFPALAAVSLDGITARQVLEARRRQFARFIANLVDVRWRDSSADVEGKVQLDRLVWDETSLCAMSTPLVRFSWSFPSPVLSVGNVSTLTLETSLQSVEVKREEQEEEEDEGPISLTDLRLDFDIEEGGGEKNQSSGDETYAFFVGSRVFKYSEGLTCKEPLKTNLRVVPVKRPKGNLLKISCLCTATIKDAICQVIDDPLKSSGRRASWRLSPQFVEVRA